jgi:DtxR family Mn-dependent transcriptional regulator
MKTSITVSKEDYLKAILEAESEGQHVIAATLAHWLSVSPPAVTMALRRLKRDGYVLTRKNGTIHLSVKGKETAYKTALRHHLIERMLSEIFGMEWYQVHDEAERLEHAVSPVFEAILIQKLGEKGTCPHGNAVLPDSPSQRKRRGILSLSEATEGDNYVVSSLYERDPELLLFLHKHGIAPRTPIRLKARNYDQTVTVETGSGTTTLGRPAAEKVWVKPE